MDKKKNASLRSLRHELLQRLTDELNTEFIPAVIREPQTENEPEILAVLYDALGQSGDEVMGEFFFPPLMGEDDQVQYFNAVLTLTEELPEERLGELYEILSYLNFLLPCGAFCVNRGHDFLVYKLSVPLDVELSEDELYTAMNVAVSSASFYTDRYVDILLRFVEGEAELEEVLMLIDSVKGLDS